MSDKKSEYWKDDPPLLIQNYPHPGGWHSTNYVPENRALTAEAERDEALAAMSADVADVVLSNAALRYELKQAQADYDTLLGEVIALRASVSFRAEGEEYEVQHGPIINQVGLTFIRLPETYIGDRVTVRKVDK